MISDSLIMEIKSKINIEDMISKYTILKRDGKNNKCICLFHSEKTPSMVIYSDTQSFYCFGCAVGGDIFSFIMKVENLGYIESVKYLCEIGGITFDISDKDNQEIETKNIIRNINIDTAKFFHQNLKSEYGKKARNYLLNRGFSVNIIKKYGIGYALDSWSSLLDYLKLKKYKIFDMYQAGVVSKSQKGSYYDQFRDRIIFPIIDIRGNIIAFGGRVLDDTKPKYLNSSDTIIFKKSKNLFSMNFAKKHIDKTVVLVEGYLDAISLYQHGFKNVVATLGTSLTSEQAILISRYSKKVIIGYDSDKAGQIAGIKASNLLTEVGLDVNIIDLKDCKDPDEYIKKYGSDRFSIIIKDSQNITDFEISKLKKSIDMDTDQGVSDYIKQVIILLSRIKNEIERDVYVLRISRDTNISKDIITSQVNKVIKSNIFKKKKHQYRKLTNLSRFNTDTFIRGNEHFLREIKAEQGIIAFILKNSNNLNDVLSNITIDDFILAIDKKIFSSICDLSAKGGNMDFSLLSKNFSEKEKEYFSSILVKFDIISNKKEEMYDYIDILVRYKQRMTKEDIINMDPDKLRDFYINLKEKSI